MPQLGADIAKVHCHFCSQAYMFSAQQRWDGLMLYMQVLQALTVG